MKTKLSLLALFFSLMTFGQNFWQATDKAASKHDLIPQNRMPVTYLPYQVNLKGLADYLTDAPDYFSKKTSDITLNIPDENGNLAAYRIYQSHTMSEGLQTKVPGIRAYRGFGVKNPSEIASIVVSPYGIHIGILRPGKRDLIIQASSKDASQVIIYTKDNVPPQAFECYVQDRLELPAGDNYKNSLIDDELLRTYRFAVGATAEYSQFHINQAGLGSGATDDQKKAAVLAAVVVTIDRLNTVYERDFGVMLELVPNEIDVIFLDPNTDPYDNDDIMQMLNNNTSILNNYIGVNNYDGGHVFSTYPGGGISGLGVICSQYKGRSVTGLNSPVGDSYDIDFVAHEVGHAFGCNHTYANTCNGQRNLSTSVEPGSGSTIMAYAGVCSPNVQTHSDDYFHVVSISEASGFISNYATCSINTNIGNHAPSFNIVDYGNVYIPANTPFMLEANATDQDNDALTYIWEQIDAVSGAESSASSWYPNENHLSGPEFRSYPPTTTGVRMFPTVASIFNGTYRNTWEVLPQVDRTMHIAVTVRDNHPGGGQTPADFITLQFDSNSGPFRITNMTQGETWQALTNHQITWDVAGTDSGLVNCPTVDILYSVDNGVTFPWVIAENIPNDGSATITVPNYQNTPLARFMVKGHNNYFFDIARGRFTITGATGSVAENNINGLKVYPNPATKIINISLVPQYLDDEVSIQLFDLSGRDILNHSYTAQSDFNKSIDVSSFAKGVYYLKITNGKDSATEKIILK